MHTRRQKGGRSYDSHTRLQNGYLDACTQETRDQWNVCQDAHGPWLSVVMRAGPPYYWGYREDGNHGAEVMIIST